jgi:hypothetical protein
MTKLAMLIAVAAATFCAQQSAVLADEVPTFDVRKSCKADVQAFQGTAGGQANPNACLADEQTARATLVSQWTQFAPETRSRCAQMVGDSAGPQSYVELLTCLQMAKDVQSLPKEK